MRLYNEAREKAIGIVRKSTNIRDRAIANYSAQSMTYSPVSPYVYSQSGQEMMCLLPASENYLMPSQGLATPKLQTKPQDFIYDENSGTLYWRRNKNSKERYRLANFEVEVEKIYTLVATNAQEEIITLTIRGKSYSVSFDMRISKLTSLNQELSAQYPQFRIFCDLARANSIFQQYISEVYEISYETLPHEIVYTNAGWQRNFNGWHYYSGNDLDCRSDFRLAVVEHEPFALIDWASSLLELADLQIMLPLFLHAHLGYTLKLFEDAGYKEQYILTVIGSSGSKKTSLARLLFSLFGDALINFTSTDRGIELDLMSRQDSSMVMDDLSSSCDKVLVTKFEKILRQLGDSSGRKRSTNGGNELDCVATRCAVVLTAETDIDALSKSSKLWTELDAKRSGRFSKLEQYITLYVKFLEAHYSPCVEFLIDSKRDTKRDFSFARQATIFNMLIGQANLILLFWETYGFINDNKNIDLHNDWENILCKVMAVNEQRGKEAEPHILFLQAIVQATHTGGISQSKDVFYESRFGFFDCGKLFLYPDAAYNYVITYYSRLGKMFTESPQNLWNKLYALNLIEVYEQKNHKAKLFKRVRVNNQSVSCLVLKWGAVKTLLENLTPEITISNGGNSNEH